MAQIKTRSGFECEINEACLDDMELLDLIADLESGESVQAYKGILDKILPNDKKRLYDHVRTEDGRVPITAVSSEITDIFSAIKDGKNNRSGRIPAARGRADLRFCAILSRSELARTSAETGGCPRLRFTGGFADHADRGRFKADGSGDSIGCDC